MMHKRLVTDNEIGTLTSFASDSVGNWYGITSAHSLDGRDRQIIKHRDKVLIWSNLNGSSSFVECGTVIEYAYLQGQNQIWDYGRVDIGLFRLNQRFQEFIFPTLQKLELSPLLKLPNPNKMRRRRVSGFSQMNNAYVYGSLLEIEKKGYDIIVKLDSGNRTSKGDSGMLIKDANGYALAIHLYGWEGQYHKTIGGVFLNRALTYMEEKVDKSLTLYSSNHDYFTSYPV